MYKYIYMYMFVYVYAQVPENYASKDEIDRLPEQ